MFIAYSFIGKLPSYIVDTIHQARLFFDGDIYLITNDMNSEYLTTISKFNIKLVSYDTVRHTEFDNILKIHNSKFSIIGGLTGREELFIRSLERFFLLFNLMKIENLSDCLFLELDNLIYDSPHSWLKGFSSKELGYMYDNDDRCSSGLMYVKYHTSMDTLLYYLLHYIETSTSFVDEMTALYRYYISDSDKVQILPTYWKKEGIPIMANTNFGNFKDSIFDALSIGCFLLGIDVFHTGGVVKTGLKSPWGSIDYTHDIFEWKIDDYGRKIPYIYTGERWIKINNLHVHSKQLINGISLPIY